MADKEILEDKPLDEEYKEPLPPTGDCTITHEMTPCIVYMALPGEVTLAKGVDRKHVRIEARGKAFTVKEVKE